jgi:hypothetical protein
MTGQWPKREIDHRNRVRDDNAWDNLREATSRQNKINSALKRSNRSGFRGVCFDNGRQKWRADIRDKGKRRTLGFYDAPELAAAAYAAAALKMHGPFAVVDAADGIEG